MFEVLAIYKPTGEEVASAFIGSDGHATTLMNGREEPGLRGPFEKVAYRTAMEILDYRHPDGPSRPHHSTLSDAEIAEMLPEHEGRLQFVKRSIL